MTPKGEMEPSPHEPRPRRLGWLKHGNPPGDFTNAPRCPLLPTFPQTPPHGSYRGLTGPHSRDLSPDAKTTLQLRFDGVIPLWQRLVALKSQ
jgi:hypothetical protein